MEKGISYFGSRLPEHVFPDLEKIADASCTYVVHTLSETDIMFNLNNMEHIVAKTKDLGMKAHLDPWGVGGVFGGETFSYFVARELKTRQVLSDGSVGALACVNHPEFRDFMHQWIDNAIAIGADVIFWDEPHFYVPGWFGVYEPQDIWGCRCSICQTMFSQKYGEELPRQLTNQVKEFQRECLAGFLTEISAYAASKGVKNTVCLLPDEDAVQNGFWQRIGRIPFIDGFGTDPYWVTKKRYEQNFNLESFVRQFSQAVKTVCQENNLEPHIWIQNFSIPEGWENDVDQAIDIVLDEGIQNLSAWAFYGTKGMSSLACDQPEVVWEMLVRRYRALSDTQQHSNSIS